LRWIGYALGAAGVTLCLLIVVGVALAWSAMGAAPAGERAARLRASPHFEDGSCVNGQPL
jgi:hypothetical protein